MSQKAFKCVLMAAMFVAGSGGYVLSGKAVAAEDVPEIFLGSPITVESTFADGTIARGWPEKIELHVPKRGVSEPLRPIINTKTVITIDGKHARPADLRVGMAAHVVFGDAQEDTAREITARSAEAIADAKSGVVMAVVMPERISVPPRDGEAKFEIGLRITNRTNQDISIDLFDTVRPVLKDGQGRELPLDGGRDKTSIPKPVEVKAGQNDTVLYAARLSVPEGKKHPRLVVDDRTGGIWVYHDLAPGRYTLGLEYAHPPAGRVAQPGRWVGATTTAPAAFEIAAIQKP